METVIINAEINKEDANFVQTFLNKIKAKKIQITEKDPTKMSKEEFFKMIDERRKGNFKRMSREERKKFLGV